MTLLLIVEAIYAVVTPLIQRVCNQRTRVTCPGSDTRVGFRDQGTVERVDSHDPD